MIKLTNIKKNYQLDKQTIKVLNDINLELYSGELSYLLGDSGCGKSTLLNIIGGLDEPSEGTYYFNNKDVTSFSEKDWASFRLNNIGFIFQTFNLIPHLSALENVEMSMVLDGVSREDRKSRALELLKLVGMDDRQNHKPNQLSGGQKQRVAIARSLANNPEVLLADEPTGALDSENSNQIMKLLKKIAQQGTTVLVVTHSHEYLSYADNIIEMKDGGILSTRKNEKDSLMYTEKNEEIKKKRKKLNKSTTLKLAVRNLINKKWRSLLTALGASIGILGILLITSLGNGINKKIQSTIDNKVENSSIAVYKENTELLDNKIIEELKKKDNIKNVYIYNPFQISLETKNGKKEIASADTLVPSEDKGIYGKSYIKYGEYPSKNNEIVVPERIAEKLYNGDIKAAIGKKVTIVSQLMSLKDMYKTIESKVIIVGIVKNGAIPLLDSVGFSYPLALDITNDNPQTSNKALQYTVIPNSIKNTDSIIQNLESIGYIAETEGDNSEELSNYVTIASIAVSLLSSISLVVSSIMIGIVMYVTVLERTREIGTLKALGAFKTDIRSIFVTEGFMIGILGGVLGALSCFIIGKFGNLVIQKVLSKPDLELFQFDLLQVLVIILFSGFLGMIASFIPSYKAAKLNPVEALRYE